MKSTDQEVNLAKSSDQRVVQTGDRHIERGLFDRISNNQGPFVGVIKRSR